MQWPSADLAEKLGPAGFLLLAFIGLLAVVLPPLLSRERQKPSDPTAALASRLNQFESRVDKIDDEQERHDRQIEEHTRRLDSIERTMAIQREVHALLGGRTTKD